MCTQFSLKVSLFSYIFLTNQRTIKRCIPLFWTASSMLFKFITPLLRSTACQTNRTKLLEDTYRQVFCAEKKNRHSTNFLMQPFETTHQPTTKTNINAGIRHTHFTWLIHYSTSGLICYLRFKLMIHSYIFALSPVGRLLALNVFGGHKAKDIEYRCRCSFFFASAQLIITQ